MQCSTLIFKESRGHIKFQDLITQCQYVMYQKKGILSFTTRNPQNTHSKNFVRLHDLLPSWSLMVYRTARWTRCSNSCSPPCAGPKMFSNIIQDSSFRTWCQHCPLSSSSCCLSVSENGIHWLGTMFWYRRHAAITLPLPQPNIIHIPSNTTMCWSTTFSTAWLNLYSNYHITFQTEQHHS